MILYNTTAVFCPLLTVKPDPPERVTATPIHSNPRRLEVSWQSPATWPDIDSFPLKYFLRYRPLIREQWQHVSTALDVKDIQYYLKPADSVGAIFKYH